MYQRRTDRYITIIDEVIDQLNGTVITTLQNVKELVAILLSPEGAAVPAEEVVDVLVVDDIILKFMEDHSICHWQIITNGAALVMKEHWTLESDAAPAIGSPIAHMQQHEISSLRNQGNVHILFKEVSLAVDNWRLACM